MVRMERFHLSDGAVEIHYPSEMTPEDVQDFEDTVAILMRVLRRRHAGVATPEQGVGPIRINEEPGARTLAPGE